MEIWTNQFQRVFGKKNKRFKKNDASISSLLCTRQLMKTDVNNLLFYNFRVNLVFGWLFTQMTETHFIVKAVFFQNCQVVVVVVLVAAAIVVVARKRRRRGRASGFCCFFSRWRNDSSDGVWNARHACKYSCIVVCVTDAKKFVFFLRIYSWKLLKRSPHYDIPICPIFYPSRSHLAVYWWSVCYLVV